jgi:Fur family ferric uptake transcriptional regulator
VCRDCGKTVEVEGPTVESWADQVASEHGFTGVTHSLEIFGTCADCSPRRT